MSWRDLLQDASFRGVSFGVRTASGTFGRRVETHKYATAKGEKKQLPFSRDIGRKERSFSIAGFVVGANYFAERDEIIIACETHGAGELVHPYFGRKQVICRACNVTENSMEGGYAAISMTFVEAGDEAWLQAADTTADVIDAAAAEAENFISDDYVDNIQIDDQPQFTLNDILRGINEVVIIANGLKSRAYGAVDQLQILKEQVEDLERIGESLVNAPADLFNKVLNIFNAVPISDSESGPEFFETDTSENISIVVTENRRVFNSMVCLAQWSSMARVVPSLNFGNATAALNWLELFLQRLDNLNLIMGDATCGAVSYANSLIGNYINKLAVDLPRLVDFDNDGRGSLPSIVIAARLYDDPNRELEILENNDIVNPFFCNGDEKDPLLVYSR